MNALGHPLPVVGPSAGILATIADVLLIVGVALYILDANGFDHPATLRRTSG